MRLDAGEKGSVTIYDMLGKQAYYSDEFINGLQQVPMDLKPGIYIISLSSSKGIYYTKLFFGNF